VPDNRKRGATASRRGATNEIDIDLVESPIGRLVDCACDNPAMSGGLLVMALTATAIVSNAMFLQNTRHPEPLFSTRPALVIERDIRANPAVVPIPPRRDDRTGSIAPPLPRAAPTRDMIAAKSMEASLIHEIQTVLAGTGLYLGSIDGVYGTLSRSAITAYQKEEGLLVNGEPSDELLDHMKMAEAVVPTTLPAHNATKVPATLRPLSGTDVPPSLPVINATEAMASEGERLRYERVQTAMNRIGYGPIAVGGGRNEETASAIRRFELDNGLPLSGTADDDVIDRLIAIGALSAN